jgi:hypothetical protein
VQEIVDGIIWQFVQRIVRVDGAIGINYMINLVLGMDALLSIILKTTLTFPKNVGREQKLVTKPYDDLFSS